MKEIRFHGRGGQGAKMAADMLATANILAGKYGASFPLFTAERRGAPMVSFARLDDVAIRQKSKIYTPDCLIILDNSQVNAKQVYDGIKQVGVCVINSPHELKERPHPNVNTVGVVDATRIAIEETGIPAFNTCMLGAFAATTKWIELDYILSSLEKYFEGKVLANNKKSAERGYREVKVLQY